MKKILFFSVLLCGALSAQDLVNKGNISVGNAEKTSGKAGSNLAFKRPYKVFPVSNYRRSLDAGDKIQLTDGKFTIPKEQMWLQKSSVCWRNKSVIQIVVDLGKVQPIQGFMISSGAGSAGVRWFEAANIYVADTPDAWYYAGDLMEKSKAENGHPREDRYMVYQARSMNMPTYGRYVCFQIQPAGLFSADELEIYRGDDVLLKKDRGQRVASTMTFFNSLRLVKHFRNDAGKILENAGILPAATQKKMADKFNDILAHPEKITRVEDKNFIPLLPLHKAQEEVFALNNLVLAAHGYTQPVFWHNCRWDNLSPIAIPPENSTPQFLKVDMMPGEVRSETVNILNPTDKVISYRVSVENLPEEANVDCREVLFMDTKQLEYVASALKPGNGKSVTVKVYPGTSRQIWIYFKKPTLKAGLYKANIKASAANAPTLNIPLHLAISTIKFPARPRLHVGGWDYLDTNCNYYNGAGNAKKQMELLKELYMDVPCGNPGILPKGAIFDKAGHLTNPDSLDFTNWQKWMARFPDARMFTIAMRCKKQFHNEPMGTDRFNTMVSEYIDAFAKYLRTTSVKPENVILGIIDEPRAPSYDQIFITWARAIQKNNPGFIIKVNPIYHNPEDATPEMIDRSNILMPDTIEMIIGGNKYRDFYWNRTKNGKKDLWLYSCSGPARLLDPIYYHRVQKWHCFYMNAKGSMYWAFGCGGGKADSWHAYAQPSTEYSPYYVSPKDVMPAKQSEGIREGVQDHEYFSMLKDRVAELKKAGKKSADTAEAEKLLAEGPKKVLDYYLKFPDNQKRYWYGKNVVIRWKTPRDRSLMDEIRIQALRLLEKLHN